MPIYLITYFPAYGSPEYFSEAGIDSVESIIVDATNEKAVIEKFVDLAFDDVQEQINIREFLTYLVINNHHNGNIRLNDTDQYTDLVDQMSEQFVKLEIDPNYPESEDMTNYIVQNKRNYVILLQMESDRDIQMFKIKPMAIYTTFYNTKSARHQ